MKLEIDSLDEEGYQYEANGTEPEQKEAQAEKVEEKKRAMKVEVKEHESRLNSKGDAVVKEVESKQMPVKDDDDEESEYAMTCTKYYGLSGLYQVDVKIYSPHIQEALSTVIKSYPGVSFKGKIYLLSDATAQTAMACLFHYRKELEAYARTREEVTAKLHLILALKFMEREFQQLTSQYQMLIEDSSPPNIVFNHTWAIFKPGELLFTGTEPWEERVVRLTSVSYTQSSGIFGDSREWTINAVTFGFNGESFGYRNLEYSIPEFKGIKPIHELAIYPLKYHKSENELRERLLARGTKYCNLAGVRYRAYDGVARAVYHERVEGWLGMTDKYPEIDLILKGRVVVDCQAFIANMTSEGIRLHSYKDSEPEKVSTEDLLICDARVAGFALADKRWCRLFVDLIDDIQFSESAWDSLMMPGDQKRMIHALAKQSTSGGDDFDDLIQGKGKGCIMLFHGEPGVGKTFTAESIAEHIKQPLYVIMSGDLGADNDSVEKNLKSVFKMVTAWKAVLLIDEADVFLEQRSSYDIVRNGLVSIFLRVLEYYEGILFLTTNRITSIDLAFKSRIHLALKYPSLDTEVRGKIWRMFLRRTSSYEEEDWPDGVIAELSYPQLNGRQIKNTVRTAQALALSEERILALDDVKVVLKTVMQFDDDFSKSP